MSRPMPRDDHHAHASDEFFVEKVELAELLMYPLPRRTPLHFEKIDWTLFEMWEYVCSEFMTDHEYRYIRFDYEHLYCNQEPWEDEIEEVRRAKINAEKWIEEAKKKMLQVCGPLYSTIAGRNEYPKHYPRFKESAESMIKRSRTADAILLEENTAEIQGVIFTKLLELRFPVILSNKDSVFIVERKKLTGYSEGKPCTKLLCKINTSSRIVHFYPVNDDEFSNYLRDYPNPVDYDPLYELDEFDENVHLLGETLSNYVEIYTI